MPKPVISFDCYATLINYDLRNATIPIVEARAKEVGVDVEELLDNLRVMRFQATSQSPYKRYRSIIHDTLETAMLLHGLAFVDEDAERLWAGIEGFQPFPEVPGALQELRDLGYELAILTNSDNDLIPHHLRALGIEFDYVVTAEQAQAYKPRDAAFQKLFEVLPQEMSQITHAAQGWEYDIMPTKKYGIDRVWINRTGRPGSEFYQPYEETRDLNGLVEIMAGKHAH